MIGVWIFRKDSSKVDVYTYEKNLGALENILRGQHGNLVVVKGILMNDVPEVLLKTFELIVLESGGFIVFPDEDSVIQS